MSENNIYAAPLSNLDEPQTAGAEARFYVVSSGKLLTLYFLTLGLYQLYWNFKNWSLHNRATDAGVWPLPRAIFAVFFTHSLFRHIAGYDATGKRGDWASSGAATGMVVLLIIGNILSRLSWKGIGSPTVDILSLLMLVPTGLLLKRVQAEVNARCGDPDGRGNARFTAANIAWCVAGGLFWGLALLGLFVDPEVE